MKLLISAVILMMSFKGDAQSLSCDSNIAQPLCPGNITKCTCVIAGAQTRWNFTTLNQCPGSSNLITLIQAAPCFNSSPSFSGTCGPYLSAANYNPTQANSNCPTSTLTITANQALNALTIECRDVSLGAPGTLIGTGTISITAPPAAPKLTWNKVSSDQFTVMLEPVPTATSYNVSVNGSTLISLPASNYSTNYSVSIGNGTVFLVSFPSNGTLLYMLNFTNLIYDTVYIVSVVAINCAGSSSPATITGTLPPPTTTTSSSSDTKVSTTTNVPTNSPTLQPPPSSSDAVGIGAGVGVGIVVLLLVAIAVVLVFIIKKKKVSPATPKGDNNKRNEEDNYEKNKVPALPPKNKDTTPSKPEGLIYADIGLASKVPMQAPNPPELSDVTYSTVQHVL